MLFLFIHSIYNSYITLNTTRSCPQKPMFSICSKKYYFYFMKIEKSFSKCSQKNYLWFRNYLLPLSLSVALFLGPDSLGQTYVLTLFENSHHSAFSVIISPLDISEVFLKLFLLLLSQTGNHRIKPDVTKMGWLITRKRRY